MQTALMGIARHGACSSPWFLSGFLFIPFTSLRKQLLPTKMLLCTTNNVGCRSDPNFFPCFQCSQDSSAPSYIYATLPTPLHVDHPFCCDPIMSLSKCIALVTGAGSGLGRATALRLAKGGASVVIVDLEKSNGMRRSDRSSLA